MATRKARSLREFIAEHMPDRVFGKRKAGVEEACEEAWREAAPSTEILVRSTYQGVRTVVQI